MVRLSREAASLLSAGVLAVLVLAVFFRLQNSGPQSVVRRYLEALTTPNMAELADCIVEPLDSPAAIEFQRRMTILIATSRSVHTPRVVRGDREARVELLFVNAQKEVYMAPLAVFKEERRDRWKIGAAESLRLMSVAQRASRRFYIRGLERALVASG